MQTTVAKSGNSLTIKLTQQEFSRVAAFIDLKTGIKLPDQKKVLVESRLQKTLRREGFESFTEYLNTVIGNKAIPTKTAEFIDLITTNKTDFFREADHFESLVSIIEQRAQIGKSNGVFKVWSAACSSGEEPYTLAMVLNEQKLKGLISDYEIYATDISQSSLQKAVLAEYEHARIIPIPDNYKRKYLLRHKDSNVHKFRIVKSLREKIEFDFYNLKEDEPNPELYDAIFCRNVFIYFDRKTQEMILHKLSKSVKSNGYIFLGHSESINGIQINLRQIKPAVYQQG
ncbi:chemotaxis protein CheR [bacterium]|nr:MAG: chemotaxis protein CheR [bacterium]